MRLALTLLRLAFLLGLASTLVAIEIARFTPPGRPARLTRTSNIVGIAGLDFGGPDDSTRFLDPEKGTMRRLPLPKGEYFDDAACSPWQDETGVSHVVGRWRKGEGEAGDEVLTELALACYTFPAGEAIGRIPCDVLPQGGACWYPGTSDRVLYTTANGSLYHVSFRTEATAGARLAGDEETPVRLRWDTPMPGGTAVMLRHPFWPRLPGFEHTVLISLRYVVPSSADQGFTNAQIWWLRLNANGTAIVAAGRVTSPLPADRRDESAPSLAATTAGLAVCFVRCTPGRLDRTLYVAPVQLDPETGTPRADASRTVPLATNCADVPPAFSPDGRWVYALLHPRPANARLQRLDVLSALTGAPHGWNAHAG